MHFRFVQNASPRANSPNVKFNDDRLKFQSFSKYKQASLHSSMEKMTKINKSAPQNNEKKKEKGKQKCTI